MLYQEGDVMAIAKNDFIKNICKKQIPIKLSNDNKLGGRIYNCPVCQKILGGLSSYQPNYCPECGQAILWDHKAWSEYDQDKINFCKEYLQGENNDGNNK